MNCTKMVHLFLSATTIGSTYLKTVSAKLGDKLITHDKQVITFIDKWGHSDRKSPFGSLDIGNEISAVFGQSTDDKIGTNSSGTIIIP